MTRTIEFTGQREYLFERDAVRFAAFVNGRPTWCVVSTAMITDGGLPCSRPVDLLHVFDTRFREFQTAAKRKLDASEAGEEIVIGQADLEHD
jgi:hypothetical protein